MRNLHIDVRVFLETILAKTRNIPGFAYVFNTIGFKYLTNVLKILSLAFLPGNETKTIIVWMIEVNVT